MKKNLLILLIFILASCSKTGPALKNREDMDVEEEHGGRKKKNLKVIESVPHLDISFLKKKSALYKPSDRTLFAFEEDPVVVAKREEDAKIAAEKARIAALAAQKQAEAEKQKQADYLRLHPPPPVPPAINFQFVGYTGDSKKPSGIFQMPNNDLVFAKEGEKIVKPFKVVKIQYDSATIGFDGFKEIKTIPLTGGNQ